MIKRTTLAALLFATPALAQEKEFDFKGITNIEVRNGITVNVIQGDELSIVGSATSGDVEQFNLQKFGSWLAVNRHTRWFIFPYGRTDELVLTITMPNARALKAYDTSSITASGFSGERLRAEALEGGTVMLDDFTYDEVSLYAADGGALAITGRCDLLEAEAVAAADVTADGLICKDADTETSSKATLSLYASDLAVTNVDKGGSISLAGDAEVVDALPEDEPLPENDVPASN